MYIAELISICFIYIKVTVKHRQYLRHFRTSNCIIRSELYHAVFFITAYIRFMLGYRHFRWIWCLISVIRFRRIRRFNCRYRRFGRSRCRSSWWSFISAAWSLLCYRYIILMFYTIFVFHCVDNRIFFWICKVLRTFWRIIVTVYLQNRFNTVKLCTWLQHQFYIIVFILCFTVLSVNSQALQIRIITNTFNMYRISYIFIGCRWKRILNRIVQITEILCGIGTRWYFISVKRDLRCHRW